MIFIYIISCIALGYAVSKLLEKVKVVELSKLYTSEKISLNIILGLISFSIWIYLLGFFNIQFTRLIVVPLIFSFIFAVISLIVQRKTMICFLKNSINKRFFTSNFWAIVTGGILLILFLDNVFIAISSHPYLPDEFSHWAIQPKLFFEGGGMDNILPTNLEHYPVFLSLLGTGIYYFIGNISDNLIRIIPSIFMLCGIFALTGIAKRRKLKLEGCYLLLSLIILFYPVFSDVLSSMYADIPFMITYGFGVMYLLEYFFSGRSNKSLFLLSLLFTGSSVWIKIDGLYLFLFTVLFLIIGNFILNKVEKKSWNYKLFSTSIYVVVPILLDISWRIYRQINIGSAVNSQTASVSMQINFDVIRPMLKSMYNQFYDSGIIVLLGFSFLILLLIGFNNLKRKDYIYFICGFLFIIVNVVFLMICYLTIFGAEGTTAASFIRYFTRVLPILIILFMEIVNISMRTSDD